MLTALLLLTVSADLPRVGVMDFQAIAEAAKAIGFQGSLSLEQDGSSEDIKATCRRYVSIMKECFA